MKPFGESGGKCQGETTVNAALAKPTNNWRKIRRRRRMDSVLVKRSVTIGIVADGKARKKFLLTDCFTVKGKKMPIDSMRNRWFFFFFKYLSRYTKIGLSATFFFLFLLYALNIALCNDRFFFYQIKKQTDYEWLVLIFNPFIRPYIFR